MVKKRLGELLVEAGLVDEVQISVAIGMQKQNSLKLGQQLLKLDFIKEDKLSAVLRQQLGIKVVLSEMDISADVIRSLPQALAFQYRVVPIGYDGKTIMLATLDAADFQSLDAISFKTGKRVRAVRALEWDIDNALLKYYLDFSDQDMDKLTNVSSIAKQYKDMDWGFGDLTESRQLNPQAQSAKPPLDMKDLVETNGPAMFASEAAVEMKALELDPVNQPPVAQPPPREASLPPREAALPPQIRRPVMPMPPPQRPVAPHAQPPTSQIRRPVPQQAPVAAQPPQRQVAPPALQPPQTRVRPEPAGNIIAASYEAQAAPSAIEPPLHTASFSSAALASDRKPTLLNALVDLLVQKGVVSEKELISALLKLERSRPDE